MDGHQAKALRETIRYAIEDGLRDAADTLTPGSPAYVRALRDRMVASFLERHSYTSESHWREEYVPAAIERANDAIRALGYEPPGEG